MHTCFLVGDERRRVRRVGLIIFCVSEKRIKYFLNVETLKHFHVDYTYSDLIAKPNILF